MTSEYARERLIELDKQEATIREQLRKRELIQANLRHQLTALGPHPEGAFEHYRADTLRDALRQLEEGVRANDAVAFDELRPLMGQPGTPQLQRMLEDAQRERPECMRVIERWPTADTTHAYRYVGLPFKARWEDGRYLEPGDVVQLTEGRAAAWGDRFEAVEEVAEVTS